MIAQSLQRFLIMLCSFAGPIEGNLRAPIHRPAPLFTEQGKSQEILVTGIKVVDLLAPYAKGGKIGLFGGAGVGKTVSIVIRTSRPLEVPIANLFNSIYLETNQSHNRWLSWS